jgi:MSHA biogenesis protein MshM
MSMYLDHFGLDEPPFRITPHTDFFFVGANRGATLDALIYAITHDEGIVKVSGEVGSGKTMLCRVLMERLPPHVVSVYLANPSLSRDDMLFAIADELEIDLPEQTRTSVVLRELQEELIALYGEGHQVVVLIDEAHAMPKETLEEIRLLSNLESNRHKLLQLVMFGQPELDATLARQDMRQLKERITQNFSLEPLVRDDIAAYLRFRMQAAGYRGPDVFDANAIRRIARASRGLTRRINIIADKALLAAFAIEVHQVTPQLVDAAIRDAQFAPIRGGSILARLTAAAAAFLVALGVSAGELRRPAGPEVKALAAPNYNVTVESLQFAALPMPNAIYHTTTQ